MSKKQSMSDMQCETDSSIHVYSAKSYVLYFVVITLTYDDESLVSCGKPCSRGTHHETEKNPALSPAFDHNSIDRIKIERLP